MNKRTVVTGGAGFIGSHLADCLVKRGDAVLIIDDFSTGRLDNLVQIQNQVETIDTDIANSETIDLIAAYKPDTVFHLAAQMDVRHSVGNPISDAKTNIIGLLNVFEGARKCQAKKVVIASSGGTIYGESDSEVFLTTDEYAKRRPICPYGVAKVASDLYLDVYRTLYGMSGTSLALGNVYGPRQNPHGEAGVVSIFAGALLDSKQVSIFGTGEQVRDFVYVIDAVEAFLCAEQYNGSHLFNIGTGIGTSINDLYKMLASITNSSDKPKFEKARKGELNRSVLNSQLAYYKLGWQPSISLYSGLERTVEWFKTLEDSNG